MNKHVIGVCIDQFGDWRAFCSCGWRESGKWSAMRAQQSALYHMRHPERATVDRRICSND